MKVSDSTIPALTIIERGRHTLDELRTAATRFESLEVGSDADNSGPRKIDEILGALRRPVVDERGLTADLQLFRSHRYTGRILEDLQRQLGIFAITVQGRDLIRPRVDIVTGRRSGARLLADVAAGRIKQAQDDSLRSFWSEPESCDMKTFWLVAQRHEQATVGGIDLAEFWATPQSFDAFSFWK